jgi:hypothetical protein
MIEALDELPYNSLSHSSPSFPNEGVNGRSFYNENINNSFLKLVTESQIPNSP